MLQLRSPPATTKTRCNQINKFFFKKKEIAVGTSPLSPLLSGPPSMETLTDTTNIRSASIY